jgi:D-alanyl-D-alanine carboxypeptidase (penicillin-binding protein 5/6)
VQLIRVGAALAAALAHITLGTGTETPVADPLPRAARAYAVVVDGELKWGRELDRRHAPASLTKLLTAVVLLEGEWNAEAIVTVSRRAAAARGARVGLRAGEQMTASELITGLLVRSGNDACIALVEHHAASAAEFAAKLNARARTLGMRASHFVDPCGFDAVGQHTTARDLLRLGAAAILQPDIATRVRLREATLRTLTGRRIDISNTNALIGREDGVVGMKSGFTSAAGKCVLVYAERNQRRIWLVLLDAPNRWWTAAGILSAASDPRPAFDTP